MGEGGKLRIKYSQKTGLGTEAESKGSAELKET